MDNKHSLIKNKSQKKGSSSALENAGPAVSDAIHSDDQAKGSLPPTASRGARTRVTGGQGSPRSSSVGDAPADGSRLPLNIVESAKTSSASMDDVLRPVVGNPRRFYSEASVESRQRTSVGAKAKSTQGNTADNWQLTRAMQQLEEGGKRRTPPSAESNSSTDALREAKRREKVDPNASPRMSANPGPLPQRAIFGKEDKRTNRTAPRPGPSTGGSSGRRASSSSDTTNVEGPWRDQVVETYVKEIGESYELFIKSPDNLLEHAIVALNGIRRTARKFKDNTDAYNRIREHTAVINGFVDILHGHITARNTELILRERSIAELRGENAQLRDKLATERGRHSNAAPSKPEVADKSTLCDLPAESLPASTLHCEAADAIEAETDLAALFGATDRDLVAKIGALVDEKMEIMQRKLDRVAENTNATLLAIGERLGSSAAEPRLTYASVASGPAASARKRPARQRSGPVETDNRLRRPGGDDIPVSSAVASGDNVAVSKATGAQRWTTVESRDRRTAAGGKVAPNAPAKSARRRLPRNAAITIASDAGGAPRAQMLRDLREKVDLAAMGIERTSIRQTASGDAQILVHGPNCAAKADILAEKAREVLRENGARVTRPVRRADVRVTGIDGSVTVEELAKGLATLGGCGEAAVRVTPFKREFIRNGQRIAWANMPLDAAIRASLAGRLSIGWSSARVELTAAKPPQCHRCWEYGHVRAFCQSTRTLTGNCFHCGGEGHQSSACEGTAKCLLCAGRGLAGDHRMGTRACASFADAVRRAANGDVARPAERR